MKERGPWRLWILSLLIIGNVFIAVVECQSRGDEGSPQELGFDGVLARHDGYVKGETPTIPQTSFSCSAQPYNPGLYADTETQCQVYHVCFEDRQESFLCGPGTNFNQRILACDFWYNFDCQDSPSFYNVNADIGKVPTAAYNPGQGRTPGGSQQQPSFPSYPRQPDQPPSVGSVPPRVSIPPPPPRGQPQTPSVVQQPPTPPRIDVPRPQVPAFRPQPEPPRGQPQVPRPQPPRGQPNYPQQPQRPSYQPEQPQRPSYQPEQPQRPSYQPEQPSFRPQPRPDPPISVKPQYPSQGSGHGSGSRSPNPSIQQEVDTGYQFDGYNPPKPAALPPPPPPRPETPRPVFPSVISPPRVSRPPLTPVVVRQPEPSISRPRVPVSPPRRPTNDFHPDAHLKGNGGDYRPPQQPREPQPSRPVGSGYPSYPVAQRPVTPVIPQRPVSRPAYQPPTIQQEHVDTEYVPPPPPPRQPSRPAYQPPPPPPPPRQPSRPAYQPPPPPPPQPKQPPRPAYQPPPPPPPQPKQPPRPAYQPPPPPPPQPKQPPRPAYQPPPPPPPQPKQPPRPAYQPPPQQPKQPSRPAYVPQVQQEVTVVEPPQRPSRPYVPPAIPQQTIEPDYGRQPPVAPSVINEQQKPASRPTSRPQTSGGGRQPAKPKPIFPPHSDHPNSNIKGGPGYNQPPPQIPRFEPARIGRPSNPQGGYVAPKPRPDPSINANKQTGDKRPSTSVSTGGYKPPQANRIKKPSEPVKEVYQPPIQVVDHPYSEIKGGDYREPVASQQPQRIKTATSSSGVKTPASKVNRQQNQPQRPRAPVVVSRPNPPSLPSSNRGVKQPSPSQVQRTTQPRFPSSDPIDHPNANVKGGYGQQSRPSGPPSSPSTSYEQKTTSTGQRTPSYPSPPVRGDGGYVQQQPEYKPERIKTATTGVKTASPSTGVKTASPSTGVKTATGSRQSPHSVAHQSVNPKQPNPNYEAGSSYTRGPEVYPKPEFGQPNSPYQPVSTPSRSSHTTKTGAASQNTISENKPAYQGQPDSSGFGTAVQPSYPNSVIPGHQPPNRPQVFPHRENPDHPNESLKGSGAYRPPPPAGFQAAASEVNLQKAVPEPEPAASLLGDVGAE